MPLRIKPIAKLSRPRLHGAVARERLYRELDAASAHAGLWVQGPPGAGKTTLVASWLDARDIPGIWYQVDSGDADLSTFFYYLQRATEGFRRKRQPPLPLLTPEYREDLTGFSRRFFRGLFELLPDCATLVLDNYQEVVESEPFHEIIAEAINEVPEGGLLIVISRRDPPDSYVRLIANHAVRLIGWDALRLSIEETRAVAGDRAGNEESVQRLHTRSGGWAAGLTLLLENSQARDEASVDAGQGLDTVFRYFAANIFERLDPPTQRLLLVTCHLPNVSVDAARALTQNERAGAILEELYRRHLFVHRRPGIEISYQYHALFRTFLINRISAVVPLAERQDLLRRSGALLQGSAQAEDAFALFLEAQDWDAAGNVVLQEASALITQGRARTLKEWIAALPNTIRDANAWFQYWQGQAYLPEDQTRARALFERACEGFERIGQANGVALAVCGVIDSVYFEWSDFGPMASCVERLHRLVQTGNLLTNPAIEMRLYSSLVAAILYGRPSHPELTGCLDKVQALLHQDLEINLKVSSATFLMTFCALALDEHRGRATRDAVRDLIQDERITPLNRLWWTVRDAWFTYRIDGCDEEALQMLDQADRLIQEKGLSGLRSATMLIASYRHAILVANRKWQQAKAVREAARAQVDTRRRIHQYNIAQMALLSAVAVGDIEEAERVAPRAHASASASGMHYVQMQAALLHATSRALAGDIEAVQQICARLTEITAGTCFTWYRTEALFIHALAIYRSGARTELAEVLRQAFRHTRISGYHFPERSYADFASLCGIALDAGIESQYVEDLVRKFRLPAPDPAAANWPWPIEIVTLGEFRILRDGVAMDFGARAPKKVLALLKALVALGGVNVSQASLVDALWGDQEGDAGINALGVAVSRLRKLLECPEAILVVDEQLTINAEKCWVDAFKFDALTRTLDVNGDAAGTRRVIDAVMLMYRGTFLPGETGHSWTIQMRMRLRDRFVSFVERAGLRLEQVGDFEAAIRCYRRGLDADDLAEQFYQGLMRCYLALGRPAEGMQVLRRLRQTLSVLLGIAPSSQSEKLGEALQGLGRPSV